MIVQFLKKRRHLGNTVKWGISSRYVDCFSMPSSGSKTKEPKFSLAILKTP